MKSFSRSVSSSTLFWCNDSRKKQRFVYYALWKEACFLDEENKSFDYVAASTILSAFLDF